MTLANGDSIEKVISMLMFLPVFLGGITLGKIIIKKKRGETDAIDLQMFLGLL